MIPKQYVEPELTSPVDLCNPDGTLNPAAIGWSRHPLHRCNLIWTTRRPKRWNYWCITGDKFLLSIALSDRGKVAVGSAYFFEYETKRFAGQTGETPNGEGVVMPEYVHAGLDYPHPDIHVSMEAVGDNTTILRAKTDNFDGQPFEAEITVVRPPGHETLNVVIPWSSTEFQFTSKQECLPATGKFRIGSETFEFAPGTAYATLDYGRGFWPQRSSWNWAAASGIQQGHVVGLNLGGKWTDGTGMNENGFVVDGRLTKLSEDLIWEYNPEDFLQPWTIRTPFTDRLYVKFEPIFNRFNETSAENYHRVVNQAVGYFNGYIVPDNGEKIELRDFFGWAEELQAIW
ncbi:MAG: DUF2804 domain-containing protein [Chloroflexota bacterium]|nr:MAG: DUF2804 domain-containing protein [Chloroflexota bacterium]